MYVPKLHAVVDEDEIRSMVAAIQAGWLVTTGRDGTPLATLLPIIWKDSTVIAHMAKANSHWREVQTEAPALLIVPGPDAYISPSWYASKAEHGRVVPTWNYTAVHLTGAVRIHQEPAWLRNAVAELTDLHEQGRERPWSITDAPDDFIDAQLRAIVGVEFDVHHIDAKAKLSQNRSQADQQGVIRGLQGEPDRSSMAVAAVMQQLQPPPHTPDTDRPDA